jgi:hypothetical protein
LGLPAGKCTFKNARLYLSTVRLVLVCRRDNPLRAFDMPLVRLAARGRQRRARDDVRMTEESTLRAWCDECALDALVLRSPRRAGVRALGALQPAHLRRQQPVWRLLLGAAQCT